MEALLGVRATPGGTHEGRGTRNALIGLGPEAYLEIIAPDPAQPDPPEPRWLGVDEVAEPRLVTWAARPPEAGGDAGESGPRFADPRAVLERLLARGLALGVDLGDVTAASRLRADGSLLSWTFTDPGADRSRGVLPFFIDWGTTAHPARSLPAECACVALEAEHPEAERLARLLSELGVAIPVSPASVPRLRARIETPSGRVELY